MTETFIDQSELISQELSRREHLEFIKYCWQKSDETYLIGKHTQIICDRIDKAIEDFRNGKSTFLMIKVPFRHGKTDIVSRYLPPHFLGEFPNRDVIIATYSADFAAEISRASRAIFNSEQYKKLYDIRISTESSSVSSWGIESKLGGTHWAGVGGSFTGRGYSLGVIDDYLKNREDAESAVYRDKQWSWFTDVFLTRRAPVSMTILTFTPWHVDDISGRIELEMKRNDNFPKFESITFPALSDEYESGTLFPERFDKAWYDSQVAALGTYGTASLLQCNPVHRGGNLLKTDKVKIVDTKDIPNITNFRWCRGWDLASTEKHLLKSDPDYTVGVLLSVVYQDKVPHLYIRDVKRIRCEAPERDRMIVQCAEIDGATVRVGIESVAGYKDTYTRIAEVLSGRVGVEQINVSRDKLIRATALEPIFEAGNVWLIRGEWNHEFLAEVGSFPSGKHDDQVDAMVCAFEMCKNQSSSFSDIESLYTNVRRENILNMNF